MTRGKRTRTSPPINPDDDETRETTSESTRILVVDDDAVLREVLSRILFAEGYLVLAASNGNEALQVVAEHPVDLVLLDLNMPGKGGWETFQRLTTDHPLLPVIIITGSPNQVFTALGAGVGGLLEKPLDFGKLRKTMKRLLAEPLDARQARASGRVREFYYNSGAKK